MKRGSVGDSDICQGGAGWGEAGRGDLLFLSFFLFFISLFLEYRTRLIEDLAKARWYQAHNREGIHRLSSLDILITLLQVTFYFPTLPRSIEKESFVERSISRN